MTDVQIIEALQRELEKETGRHLYAVLGRYAALARFEKNLTESKLASGRRFPAATRVTRELLGRFRDEDLRQLVESEARRPQTTVMRLQEEFQGLLVNLLGAQPLVVLCDLELLLAFDIELSALRTSSRDDRRIVLLLPGHRRGDRIEISADPHGAVDQPSVALPNNLLTGHHIWELDS